MSSKIIQLDDKKLNCRIRIIREKAGLNQEEFAKRLGLTVNTINRYEKGHRVPGAEFLIRLVEKFDCNSYWLLTGKEEKEEHLSLNEKQIIKILRKYPSNMQPMINKTFHILLSNYFEKFTKTPKERRAGEVKRLQEIIKVMSIRK